ncbi:MAG: acyltransferase, partial [Anaerolineae bacterium]|nr:acyltransferase [Anaerolineae bacterium]
MGSRARAPSPGRARQHHAQLPYLPALDGLRALAVIPVLLYHADPRCLPGGFLGVEVFFVLSGYLITSLLLAEWQTSGRIDLPRFWLRRARRLLPALIVLIVAVLGFAVLALPEEVAALRGDVAAAAAYVTNWYLVLSHKPYFQTVGRPSLLKHLWSLAVEEQYYLLWPVLFAGGMRLVRRRWMLPLVLAGALASGLWMAILQQAGADPSRLYYGTDTRAASLLGGGALALAWPPGAVVGRVGRGRAVLDLAGLGALGLLAACCVRLDEFQPLLYRGGFALVGLGTLGLIAIVARPGARLVAPLLGSGPLRWLGVRSYSIYLWHWPIFAVTRPGLDVGLRPLPLLALRLAATLLLADLSYRCVETPIRRGALGQAWRAWRAAGGGRRRRLG